MKYFMCLILILFAISASSQNLSKDIQVDILMGKITSLFQANREGDALPYFKEMEQLGVPLPETFHYYQITALEKSNQKEKALEKAEFYLNNFGKKGKYYSNVVEKTSKLSMQVAEDKANAAAAAIKKIKDDQEAKEKKCKDLDNGLTRAKNRFERALRDCINNTSKGRDLCIDAYDFNGSSRRSDEKAAAESLIQDIRDEIKELCR